MAEETDEQNMLRLSQDELAVIASLLAPEDLGAFSRSCKHCRGALAAQLKAAYGECRLIITTHAPFLLDACGRHNWPQRYEYFEIRPQTLGDRGVRMFAHIVRLVTESEHSFDPVIIDHACDGVNFTDQGCSADVALKMCEAAQASGVLKVLCSKHIHPRVHVPTDLFGRTVQLDRPSADQKYRWTDADAIFVAHSLPALERPVELQLGSSPSFAGGVPARHEIGDKGAFALAVGLQRTRGGVAYCNLLKCRFGVQSAWALVAATEPAADADGGGGGGAAVAARLLRALRSTLGLKRAAKLGLASADACGARLARAITKKGRLRWRRVFADGKLPLKLEVAAGTGDWVAAHAAAEAGEANWGALELRHDRVYSIFSRMLLGNHPNLCVMGGDAAAILRNHVKRASCRHIFINFPEPPTGASHAADAAAMAEASDSALHLLTPPFFRAMHAALEVGGRITILSDNEGYCRALAATAAALRDGETRLLVSERIGGAERLAVIDGVHVYKGQPGAAAGHAVEAASYFDRFWEHGSHRERWYLVLRREFTG